MSMRVLACGLVLSAWVSSAAASSPAPSLPAVEDSARVPAGLGVPSAPVTRLEGVPMVGANDLARLLGSSRTWRARVVPDVLVHGDHGAIERWRAQQARDRTLERRPDLVRGPDARSAAEAESR